MYPRLKLVRNILAQDGVILISIDDGELATLRLVVDEVFGHGNFIGTLIHQRAKGGGNARHLVRGHDYILAVARDIELVTPLRRDKVIQGKVEVIDGIPYLVDDDVLRKTFGKYETGTERRCLYEEINKYKGEAKKAEIDAELAAGTLLLIPWTGGNVVARRTPIAEAKSKLYSIVKVLSEEGAKDLSSLGMDDVFSYPKPRRLMQQIVQAATSERGDIVLDLFSGSGSAIHGVFDQNVADGLMRHFIAVQLDEDLHASLTSAMGPAKVTLENAIRFTQQLEVEPTVAEICKERIRRAGTRVLENPISLENEVDIGFRVLKVDTTNIANVLKSPDDTDQEELSGLQDSIKSHRTSEDLLFQVLLDWGLDLSLPIVGEYIDGSEVFVRVFEEEYAAAVTEVLAELALDEATTAYQEYLRRDSAHLVHQGYFSIDKRSKHQVEPAVAKRGEEKGQSTDVDAYDLILRRKERLLSSEEPVRFLFSHSALREGWDNPNVFVMGMLKKSNNTVSRRQEIGRGLRIFVNQDLERVDDEAIVHEINELTVVTDESYTAFVDGLQKEMAESLSARPRKATPEFFAGKELELTDGSGEKIGITIDQAKQLQHWLTVHGFIDYEQHLTEKWLERADDEMPELPGGLQPFFYQVAEVIDSLDVDIPLPADGRKPKLVPLNKENFERKEFQELWARISRKTTYQVEFDTGELVAKCVAALDAQLQVAQLQYVVEAGRQNDSMDADDLAERASFTVRSTTTHMETVTASSQVKYDLLGEITEKTQLTRRTAGAILAKVKAFTFAKYRQNPEQFITEAARIVNEQKAAVIVEHLTYDTLVERHDAAIFTENQTKQDFSKAGEKLKKHVYDYVVTDSKVERAFVTQLDTSTEVVVYAKLPRGFSIPTPVGNYNPDWAIAFQEGSVKHVYFVAETKGSLSSLQLRPIEQTKIECARRFFASLAAESDRAVTYDVVENYGQLMHLVGVGES